MERSLRLACSVSSKFLSGHSSRLFVLQKQSSVAIKKCLCVVDSLSSSRTHSTLASLTRGHTRGCSCSVCAHKPLASYSTEIEKEISKFLDKEIQFEKSRAAEKLPQISGFDIKNEGGDVTLTKTSGGEKIVVTLSVNGAVDSTSPVDAPGKQEEPPQMICRPPFDVEITKGNTVLALQCTFPSSDAIYEEGGLTQSGREQIEDQFEIQEVAIHDGEWKDETYSVSAATMDAEMFDLLMDMLDERGINDEFITQLVQYSTAYENKQYINFLQSLKSYVEK